MLKADLHIHTQEDPVDPVYYSAAEVIKYKAKQGFKVLAITNHNSIFFNKGLEDYARRYGVVLIPGMEMKVCGKEILVLNADKSKADYWEPHFIGRKRKYRSLYNSFDILDRLRDENMVIGAPHPFYPQQKCLGKSLLSNIDRFDYIEYCYYYLPWLDHNKKAVAVAKRYDKPLVAASDAHHSCQLNVKNYSYIDAEPDKEDILDAIVRGRVKIITQPLSHLKFSYIGLQVMINKIKLLSNE